MTYLCEQEEAASKDAKAALWDVLQADKLPQLQGENSVGAPSSVYASTCHGLSRQSGRYGPGICAAGSFNLAGLQLIAYELL